MVLLNQNNQEKNNKDKKKLFCQIRSLFVVKTPEEEVRQELLYVMLTHLGYPKSHLAVEVALKTLVKTESLLSHSVKEPAKIPSRRLDIVVYRKTEQGTMAPLLLIECKEKKEDVSMKAVQQLLGYNYYVRAPFVALAAKEIGMQLFSAHTFCHLGQDVAYHDLLSQINH